MEFPRSPEIIELRQHVHVAEERCPTCGQPIPNDKAVEIRSRMEAEERQRTEALTARLRQAEAAGRDEGKKEAEAGAQQQIAALEQANADLLEKRDNVINERVREAREAKDKEKDDALGARDAKHFQERQKLTEQLEKVTRQLENKTAEELGEGAEVNLFEALREEFPDDRIERIGKGAPGADIRHVVLHNAKECGTIVYDSKNRGAWRNDYVDKLARDQRADKAEHAILSTLTFPAKVRQLHIEHGIIIANPARVLAIVHLLRKHIVHVHTLRLSSTDLAKKTAALYDFITSERCTQLLDAIDTQAGDLLQLQEKEMRAHEATWRKQGTLYRAIQKTRADLCSQIDVIIGSE
jgi:hypothetical protein